MGEPTTDGMIAATPGSDIFSHAGWITAALCRLRPYPYRDYHNGNRRSRQSGTVVSGPYRRAISARSGSTPMAAVPAPHDQANKGSRGISECH
jgi:hypothetical protein